MATRGAGGIESAIDRVSFSPKCMPSAVDFTLFYLRFPEEAKLSRAGRFELKILKVQNFSYRNCALLCGRA